MEVVNLISFNQASGSQLQWQLNQSIAQSEVGYKTEYKTP